MREMTHEALCDWRYVDPRHACTGCGASGVKSYPNTATWRGGIGGQAFTTDVCDKCWGSGDQDRPWPDRRKLEPLLLAVEKVRQSVISRQPDGSPLAQLVAAFDAFTGRRASPADPSTPR